MLDLFAGAGNALGSDTERAWAAGFFDGEGYVGVRRDKRPGRNLTLQLSIEQVDRRPLDRFAAAVGIVGRVGPRRAKRAPNRRLIHRMHLGHAQTLWVMSALWPWLSEPKREQFSRAAEEVGVDVSTSVA